MFKSFWIEGGGEGWKHKGILYLLKIKKNLNKIKKEKRNNPPCFALMSSQLCSMSGGLWSVHSLPPPQGSWQGREEHWGEVCCWL